MTDPTAPIPAADRVPAGYEDLATESEELRDEDIAAGDADDEPDDPTTGTDPDSLLPVEGIDVDEDVDRDGEAPQGTTLTDAERADREAQVATFEEANAVLPPDQRVPLDQVN